MMANKVMCRGLLAWNAITCRNFSIGSVMATKATTIYPSRKLGSRNYSTKKSEVVGSRKQPGATEKLPGSITDKFIPFEDEKRVIQDVIEKKWDPIEEEPYALDRTVYKRGKTGVFDLPDLLLLLREENALDVCVIRIPHELRYADHMVIVTARSVRHLFALATFVRKRFKMTQLKKTDRLPKIEGTEDNDDWIAIDLGNIVLHIFIHECRQIYDLETLWTVGSKFDDLTHQEDSDVVQLLNMFT